MKTNKKISNKVAKDDIITSDLIEALRNGDHSAYATLYCHFRQPIEMFVFSLLKSHTEAEDITQEVFMKIWEKRETIDLNKQFKTFLYTIAKNEILNKFNHQKVRDKYSKLNQTDHADYITQEEVLIAKETDIIIALIVNKMPKIRKSVYQLSTQQMLTNDEIALMLGTTKENVANHLSQAKKEIKSILVMLSALLGVIYI